MQTYTDPSEEIVVGIASDDPQYIIDILQELLGCELEPNSESKSFEDVGAFYEDTVVVRFGLVDEEILITMTENDVYVVIAP